ncbi:ATP-NAD kinase-like domain-containing protein [Mycena floridula]|nr:ATP-NAD kinase-like domain-containing protein [Mycena floridula]
MGPNPFSPDTDTFSTPPTTPGPDAIRPSLSRKSSRPSSLLLEGEWRPAISIEEVSPDISKKMNGSQHSPMPESTPKTSGPSPYMEAPRPALNMYQKPTDSPCFVHSYLDKGASLNEWFRTKQNGIMNTRSANNHNQEEPFSPSESSSSSIIESTDEDDEGAGNLTTRLAETAVGVREMSKQLGRARVRSNIQSVLIITKARDNRLIKLTRDLALYLMLKERPGHKRGLIVYVDNQLRKSRRFDVQGIERDHPELFVPFPRRRNPSSTSVSSMTSASANREDFYLKEEGQLRYWTMDMCNDSPHLFDFVVTLGGDGTVLFTSWLFQRVVPPVLPFALGSLGFLTNFDFNDHQAVMDSVIDSGIRVNLRMRFTCTVYRAVVNESGKGRKAVKKGETGEIMMKNVEKGGWEALEGGWNSPFTAPEAGRGSKDKEIMCFTTRAVETFEVLNELVVDRGPSPYVSLLELFGDEHHMTTVQADGLTVSTPTGSTAYSLSAGGSLVHPEIPALLITPICPHTLSFRPMLLPDSMELRICVPFNSRSTAWASFDGRGRVELKQGDHIKVTASKYPFPTVCADKQSTDWFHAISRTLKWNERERQKSFVVVEEGPKKTRKRTKQPVEVPPPTVEEEAMVEDDEEDEVSDDEDDKFDIDDSSPEAAAAAAAKELASDSSPENTQPESRAPKLLTALRARRRTSKSRSRSRSGLRSGVDSPGRFAGHHHNPPAINSRHIGFDTQVPSPTSSTSSADSVRNGARDDIHAARRMSNKSRIPRDRDLELEAVKTPTVANLPYRNRHSRSRSADHGHHRAFAVWGHDESDSNTSDSDV